MPNAFFIFSATSVVANLGASLPSRPQFSFSIPHHRVTKDPALPLGGRLLFNPLPHQSIINQGLDRGGGGGRITLFFTHAISLPSGVF